MERTCVVMLVLVFIILLILVPPVLILWFRYFNWLVSLIYEKRGGK